MNRVVQKEKVIEARVLGLNETCLSAAEAGVDSGCATLTKIDGLYHCDECGLVYSSDLDRSSRLEISVLEVCDCHTLTQHMENPLLEGEEDNNFHSPERFYTCTTCGKYYNVPSYAKVDRQKSPPAKEEVENHEKVMFSRYSEQIKAERERLNQAVDELITALRETDLVSIDEKRLYLLQVNREVS